MSKSQIRSGTNAEVTSLDSGTMSSDSTAARVFTLTARPHQVRWMEMNLSSFCAGEIHESIDISSTQTSTIDPEIDSIVLGSG